MKHGSQLRVFGLSLGAILPAAGVSLSWFCFKGLFNISWSALIAFLMLAPAACQQPRANAANRVAAELNDLQSLDELKTLFNNDHGAPRLVLLLSPT